MKFRLHRLSDYSDEALLSELRRVATLVSTGPLSRSLFREHSAASASTIMKRFGGWREALEAAGVGSRYGGKLITERMRQQPGKGISRDVVLAELRRVAAELGREGVTVEDFEQHASFSAAPVRAHFSLWRQALEAAGLTASPSSVRYTDEECYENLLQVWTHFARPPKYREMGDPPSQVGGKAYVKRWGTWLKALEAFVQRVNEDVGPITEHTPAVEVEPSKSPENLDDGRVRLGIRYKVLVRDNFKCMLCGNSPAVDPACRLHVDHVHPYSKGGPTILENLRTLCDACNIGKSNRTIENAR